MSNVKNANAHKTARNETHRPTIKHPNDLIIFNTNMRIGVIENGHFSRLRVTSSLPCDDGHVGFIYQTGTYPLYSQW